MRSSVISKISIFISIVALLCIGWLYFGPEANQSKKIRNVLLISMDTTRSDIIGCYGSEYNTTPNIDALAAEGAIFENAYAPVPITLPSHSTMLTGTIPPYHGVYDNDRYKLKDSDVTLAEILKDNGFATGAIVGTVILDSKYGLDQGFDFYDDNFKDSRSPLHILERQGEEIKRLASDWLDKHQKENMFLFLHFFDPHKDYDPPEPYNKMFLSNPPPKPDTVDYRKSLYAGEVAYTDNCIKGVIDKLKQLGLYDSTLIIITADHGEMLNQHKETSHGYYIYQGSMKIPLVFKVPGISTPRRIEKTVGLVDITPTVCSLLDIKGPYTFQGKDISPYLLQDERVDLNRHICLVNLFPTKYKCNSLLGIVNDRYKYIQTTRPELYDIVKDNAESNNLIKKYPKIAHLLKSRLQLMLDDSIRSGNADSKMQLDAETLKQLETLGYVTGKITEDFTFDTSKKDPKDLIDYHEYNAIMMPTLFEKEFDLAKQLCEKMILIQPDLYIAYFQLARIAQELEDYPEAIEQLTKAIEIEPDQTGSHNLIADIYRMQDNREQAIIHLNKSLKINPEQSVVHGILAHLYYKQGNIDKAIFHSQESLRIKPDQLVILNQLAALYHMQKKTDRTVEYLNKSLQIKPKQPGIMSKLATLLYGQRKVAEAMTLWSDSLEIDPKQVSSANFLAWVKATSKNEKFYDPTNALTLARRACELTDYKDPGMLDTLAAALAANAQFDKAVETVAKAIKIAGSNEQNERVRDFQKHLNLYKAQKSLHEHN